MAFDFNNKNGDHTHSENDSQSPYEAREGFNNLPVQNTSNHNPSNYFQDDVGYGKNDGKIKRPFVHRPINIPWRIILPLIIVLAVVAWCWINRDFITAVLNQFLKWTIIILIIIVLIKRFISPRKR